MEKSKEASSISELLTELENQWQGPLVARQEIENFSGGVAER